MTVFLGDLNKFPNLNFEITLPYAAMADSIREFVKKRHPDYTLKITSGPIFAVRSLDILGDNAAVLAYSRAETDSIQWAEGRIDAQHRIYDAITRQATECLEGQINDAIGGEIPFIDNAA